MSKLGDYADGELYPNTTRTQASKLKGHTLEIQAVTYMEKDDYFVVSALDETDKNNAVSFGSSTAQTTAIKKFLSEDGTFPQKVKVGSRKLEKPIAGHEEYTVFENVK